MRGCHCHWEVPVKSKAEAEIAALSSAEAIPVTQQMAQMAREIHLFCLVCEMLEYLVSIDPVHRRPSALDNSVCPRHREDPWKSGRHTDPAAPDRLQPPASTVHYPAPRIPSSSTQ
jgi:hypothetical protein